MSERLREGGGEGEGGDDGNDGIFKEGVQWVLMAYHCFKKTPSLSPLG